MRLISFFSVLFFLHFTIKGQCDVAITDVNLNTYEVTVEVINSAGCTANGPGGVNGAVTMLQIGYHLPEAIDPDNEVVDLLTLPNAPCSPQWVDNGYNLGMNPTSFHPGWWYSPSTSVTFQSDIMGDGLITGDVVTIPLNPPGDYITYPNPVAECGDDLIDYWLSEDECIEFVVWQLNYGSTWYENNGGWATGEGPGTYQDQNCNNSWYLCRDENPGAAVASPDFACPPDAPDAVVGDIEFDIGCIGDIPTYQLTYTVFNYGNAPITDYCIEIWNEDYYQCFDSELFGSYEIGVGEGQQFTTPFFEYDGGASIFVVSVDNVNDEVITGNNNTSVYYPDELDELVCPEVCEPDTVEIETITYITQIDSIFITDTAYDTIYIQLPPEIIYDTLVVIDVVDNFIYDTIYVDNFIYDTVYVDNFIYDTVYVDNFIYDTTYIYVELPPDTLIVTEVEYVTDTIYIDNYIYEYDTVYVDVPIVDTLYITETEYIVDTLFVTEYITITDTITEYIVQEMWIDCITGLPCDEEPPGMQCPDWTTIHIPNTFTPNNDGHNDVWKVIYDLSCWEDVEFKIFNRWGNQIYEGYGDYYESYPFWDGSVNGGDYYAQDGVYFYLFKAKKVGMVEVIEKQGHITIFR